MDIRTDVVCDECNRNRLHCMEMGRSPYTDDSQPSTRYICSDCLGYALKALEALTPDPISAIMEDEGTT